LISSSVWLKYHRKTMECYEPNDNVLSILFFNITFESAMKKSTDLIKGQILEQNHWNVSVIVSVDDIPNSLIV